MVSLFAFVERPESQPVLMCSGDAIKRSRNRTLSRRIRPPAPGSECASLSVLPFISLSAGKDDEYLAAGITAELTSALQEFRLPRCERRERFFDRNRRGTALQKFAP